MGTLYERNQRHLKELKDGYEGMLVILQQFLCNLKNSEADSYRLSSHATKIAEALGLDPESTEDLRTAALLSKVNEIGISNEILYKAANLSEEELEKGMRKAGDRGATKAQLMGGSLRRAIPILVAAQELNKTGATSCGLRRRSADLKSGPEVRSPGRRRWRGENVFRPGSREDRKRLRRKVRFDDCGRFCESLRSKSTGGYKISPHLLLVSAQSLPHFDHA